MSFFEETKTSNPNNFSVERHDKLLGQLLLDIRKDLGINNTDDPQTFDFHLISG